MSDELSKIKAPKSKDFKLESIESINYKPHPYCITPEHLSEDSMYLGRIEIEKAEANGIKCGMYYNSANPKMYTTCRKRDYTRCELPYDKHTVDKVLFIKALVDKKVDKLYGLKVYLKNILPIMKKLHIDGVAFIESDTIK